MYNLFYNRNKGITWKMCILIIVLVEMLNMHACYSLGIRVFLKNESLRTMFSNPPLHYAGHREAVVKIIAQNNNI